MLYCSDSAKMHISKYENNSFLNARNTLRIYQLPPFQIHLYLSLSLLELFRICYNYLMKFTKALSRNIDKQDQNLQ